MLPLKFQLAFWGTLQLSQRMADASQGKQDTFVALNFVILIK